MDRAAVLGITGQCGSVLTRPDAFSSETDVSGMH